ncbi:hypothetical protein GCM10011491_07350 [Brucella endophytica]|uniref:Uncharacterized protein n=1 Tax=Brucella endophytica TaxID=1963359 RepID=A0A916WBB0_9HYPH|nr:hypothetical protein [Brucella endophytica]GGA82465.1 hypothetical protein GCM10011491_07350 [Brucella endophytica]
MDRLEKCHQCGKLALEGEMITITVSEYESLKSAAASTNRRKAIAGYRAASSSKIGRTPELAEFIIECAATMTVAEIAMACREKFGDKTPSWSSIYRFVAAMKRHRQI